MTPEREILNQIKVVIAAADRALASGEMVAYEALARWEATLFDWLYAIWQKRAAS
jgi:hypothetical protein